MGIALWLEPGVAIAEGMAARGALEESAVRRWRRHAGVNFELCACGSADEVQKLTEALETELAKLRRLWSIADSPSAWSPRCKVFVHDARAAYLAAAGPGAERTNGSSLVHFERGRVVGRRIDVDGQGGDWQTETLPHELTHVMLADEFPHGRLPRWADEGAAMLADTADKRARHRQDLDLAGRRGRRLPLGQLLGLELSPPHDRLAAFYGQSLSLVEHLVARGDRRRFLDFLHEADRAGYDASLRTHYGLASPGKLAVAFEPPPSGQRHTRIRPQLTAFASETPPAIAPSAAGRGNSRSRSRASAVD